MEDLFKAIVGLPIANLLILGGLACVLIAVAGNINGKIEPGRTGRIAAGIIGVILLCAGLAMQVSAKTVGTPATETPGPPSVTAVQAGSQPTALPTSPATGAASATATSPPAAVPPTPTPTAAPTPSIAEDCLGFDYQQAAVKEVGGRWKIVVDSVWLMDFGGSQAEATAALNIIKHYRMNDQCFVGRPAPSLEYFLVNRTAPAGSVPGEDCLSLKLGAAQLEVKQLSGRWKIVAGDNWIFDFADKESEARMALAIIKAYRFEYVCYVGRPDPSMTYLRR